MNKVALEAETTGGDRRREKSYLIDWQQVGRFISRIRAGRHLAHVTGARLTKSVQTSVPLSFFGDKDMKSIKRVMRVLALVAMVGAGLGANAEAAVISISPSSQNANVGNTVNVDILVSLGLGEVVGGVSLFLGFNPAILTGVSYTVDPDGAMGVSSGGFDMSGGFAGGSLDLYFLGSNPLPAQGGGFRLATVSFLASGPGTTALTLSHAQPGGAFLSDANGNVLAATAVNGSVCVGPSCFPSQVPEPGTLALLGMGLAIAGYRHRKNRRG